MKMILFSNQMFVIFILIIIGEIVIGQSVLSRCKKKMVSNFLMNLYLHTDYKTNINHTKNVVLAQIKSELTKCHQILK